MYKFNVSAVGALDLKNADLNKFITTSTSEDLNEAEFVKIIPMMQRRRLNKAGRYAVALGKKCLELYENKFDKIIFASRTGESQRCLKLLSEVEIGNGVSPTEFSASVHNANVGILSIISKFKGETVAIAACDKTFKSAIEEAYITLYSDNNSFTEADLAEFKNKNLFNSEDEFKFVTNHNRVLVVFYEENLHEQNIMDMSPCKDFDHSFAYALVLEKVATTSKIATHDVVGTVLNNSFDFNFSDKTSTDNIATDYMVKIMELLKTCNNS